MDSDTYDHDECSYLNRAKGVIRVVPTPAGFQFPVRVTFREPVKSAFDLPHDFEKGEAAYDLSDPVYDSRFSVGLGDGKACLVTQIWLGTKVCPHCGYHL